MQNKLHPAGLIEKAFGNDSRLRGQRAELRRGRSNVGRCLLCSRLVQPAFINEESRYGRIACEDSFADLRYLRGEFSRAPGRFSQPKRNGRGGAVCVDNTNSSRFHSLDTPGMRAEEKNIPDQTLHSEVFVQSS